MRILAASQSRTTTVLPQLFQNVRRRIFGTVQWFMNALRSSCWRRGRGACLLLSFGLFPLLSTAADAPGLLAQRVLRPAAYARGAETVTLLPGLRLLEGDGVHTGRQGYVQLSAPDGLRVALAANTRIRLHQLTPEARSIRLEEGVMELSAPPSGVVVNVGRIELRVRGGQLWVDASPLAERLCLSSGSATVSLLGRTQPLQGGEGCLRDSPEGLQPYQPDAEQRAAMAASVAFAAQSVASLPPHGWTLIVASIADEPSARAEADGLEGEGLAVRILPFSQNGLRSFRVAVGGFASKEEAEAFVHVLRARHGILEAWASPY